MIDNEPVGMGERMLLMKAMKQAFLEEMDPSLSSNQPLLCASVSSAPFLFGIVSIAELMWF